MQNEHKDRPVNLALVVHEQVVDDITARYIEGPRAATAKEDARRFFESKINYSKTNPDDFLEGELKICEEALSSINQGNWESVGRAILRSCRNFLEADDEGLDKIAIAFANLANSLPTSPAPRVAKTHP